MKKLTLTIISMMFIAYGAFGQNCSFTTWNTGDGLIHNKVNDIAEDSQGNLWFATSGGLSMFDGTTFTNYTKAQDTIPDDDITCIAVDTNDNVWFSSEWGNFGVVKFDGNNFTVMDTADGLADLGVSDIHVDQFGRIWFGHFGGGASVYRADTFAVYSMGTGDLCDDYVTAIDSRYGKIYLNGYNGCINVLDGMSWDTITRPSGIAELSKMAVDAYENVWVITYNFVTHNVWKWTAADSMWTDVSSNVPQINYLENVFADPLGSVWVSSDTGLVRYDTTKGWSHYVSQLAGQRPTRVAMSSSFDIYIGDWGTNEGFTKLEQTGGLMGDMVGPAAGGNDSYMELYSVGADMSLSFEDSLWSDGAGRVYDFGAVPVGLYSMRSWKSETPSINHVVYTWYNTKNTWEEAEVFSVATCETATIVPWESNRHVRSDAGFWNVDGTVYEEGGSPDTDQVEGALVVLRDSATGQVWDDVWTEADGKYQFRFLEHNHTFEIYVEQLGVTKTSIHKVTPDPSTVQLNHHDFELGMSAVAAIDNTPIDVSEPNNELMKIWPNPAQDKIYVEAEAGSSMEIYSITGVLVLQRNLNDGLNQINVADLNSGMYLLKVSGSTLSLQAKLFLE